MKLSYFAVALWAVSLLGVSCSSDVDLDTPTTSQPTQRGYAITLEGILPTANAKSSITDDGINLNFVWESSDKLYAAIIDNTNNPILFNNNTQEYANVSVTPDGVDGTTATLVFDDLTTAESIPAGSTLYIATAGTTPSNNAFNFDFTFPMNVTNIEDLGTSHVVFGSYDIDETVDLASGESIAANITFAHMSTMVRITLINGDSEKSVKFSDFEVTASEALGVYSSVACGYDSTLSFRDSATSLIDLVNSEITINAGEKKEYYINFVSSGEAITSEDNLITITAGGKTASVTKSHFEKFENGVRNTIEFTIPEATTPATTYTLSDFGAGGQFETEGYPEGTTWVITDETTPDLALSTVVLPVVINRATESGTNSTKITLEFPNATTLGNYTLAGARGLVRVVADEVVTASSQVFTGCTELTSVSMEKCETTKGNCFSSSGLTSISLPELTTLGTTCFKGCTSLRQVSLPKLTNIPNGSFDGCVDLELNLESVTQISKFPFTGTTIASLNLGTTSSIQLSNCDNNPFRDSTDGVTGTENPAITANCALTFNELSPELTNTNGRYWVSTTTLFKSINGNTNDPVFAKGSYFLSDFKVDGTLPETDDNGYWTIMNSGTVGDSGITGADGTRDTSLASGTTIAGLVDAISRKDGAKIRFAYATKLNDYALYGCGNLVDVVFDKSVALGGRSLAYCGFTTFDATKVTSFGSYAFQGAIFTSFTMSAAVDIGSGQFANATNLETLSFVGEPDVDGMAIGNQAFAYCKALTSLSLPYANSLGEKVFNNASKLTEVRLTGVFEITCNEGTFTNFSGEDNKNYSGSCDLYLGSAQSDYDTTANSWGGATWQSITIVSNE